jgi:hypothetical protein
MSTEIKIKARNLKDLQMSIATLVDGKCPSKAKPEVETPFEFAKGTRWNLLKNIRILRQEIESFEDERLKLIKKYQVDEDGNATPTPLDDPSMKQQALAFSEEFLKMAEDEITINTMLPVKATLLRIDENGLGTAVEMLLNYGLVIDDIPVEA